MASLLPLLVDAFIRLCHGTKLHFGFIFLRYNTPSIVPCSFKTATKHALLLPSPCRSVKVIKLLRVLRLFRLKKKVSRSVQHKGGIGTASHWL